MGEGGWVSFRTPSGTNLPRKKMAQHRRSLCTYSVSHRSEGMKHEIRWLLTVIQQLKKVLVG